MDNTQIYKKCMAEGELEIKGAPTVYCKSLKFLDGHIMVYTNDSNDLNLNEKFSLEMKGFEVKDQENQTLVEFSLGPKQQKILNF